MKKKPRKKKEAQPETPPTFLDVVRAKGWGQGDRAMHPEPSKDRYFITTRGQEDPNWEPGPDDWALFAEMMRDRVTAMREPKP